MGHGRIDTLTCCKTVRTSKKGYLAGAPVPISSDSWTMRPHNKSVTAWVEGWKLVEGWGFTRPKAGGMTGGLLTPGECNYRTAKLAPNS
jgi:hypothetical protein